RLIKSGKLKAIIDNGIMGLTSNPTIFQKAVAASDIYKEQIEELAKAGKSAKEIYDAVTISDVREAADLLEDVYLTTGKIDGYVSIEVYPEYAHDPAKTIEYARDVYKRINRKNIMIKVPGTREGYEAVKALIKEGISVNVTLLFSVEHYRPAALAYIDGLRERVKGNKDIKDIRSVASVFISRIDTRCDKILDEKGEGALKGRAAVANTRMVYQAFKDLFSAENFDDLRKKGAEVQRPLWASTSAKNPVYKDIKYVEELVAKDTVNTIPHATMEAYLDHGEPQLNIEDGLDGVKNDLEKFKALGIDMTGLCQSIQDDGVDAFQRSFDDLIGAIEKETKR
ncbi:MAG: transaldolase, partial [Candidatus Omnitrophica bacterium]|nr:transaldolase [Candidatus Omnitrophota bacterium]